MVLLENYQKMQLLWEVMPVYHPTVFWTMIDWEFWTKTHTFTSDSWANLLSQHHPPLRIHHLKIQRSRPPAHVLICILPYLGILHRCFDLSKRNRFFTLFPSTRPSILGGHRPQNPGERIFLGQKRPWSDQLKSWVWTQVSSVHCHLSVNTTTAQLYWVNIYVYWVGRG